MKKEDNIYCLNVQQTNCIFEDKIRFKELLEAPALPERTLFTEIGGLARSRPVAFFFACHLTGIWEKCPYQMIK